VQVSVYPADFPNKPPVGKGLNRAAVVTLFNVLPKASQSSSTLDASTREAYAQKVRLPALPRRRTRSPALSAAHRVHPTARQVKDYTERSGAHLLHYYMDTGTWIFEVDHFSR
jgi:hypothetical protein